MLCCPNEDLSLILFWIFIISAEGEGKTNNLLSGHEYSLPLTSLTIQGLCSVSNLCLGLRVKVKHKPTEASVFGEGDSHRYSMSEVFLQPRCFQFYQLESRWPHSHPPSTCHHQQAKTPDTQTQAKKE